MQLYKLLKGFYFRRMGMDNHRPNMLYCRLGILFAALLLFSCANVVSPTGGPRDEDPPVVVRSEPPNFSPNFPGGEVRIFFDEFVELRNVRQQMMISPPLETNPDFRVRGRSVVFSIEEELRENVTYSIFLGDAIRDITEGNAIPNFRFVFSTGDYVDSLSVRGKVLDALTLKPVKDVFVMMYDNVYDSVPYLERPVYLAKTGEDGHFSIASMREGKYLMFGLVDNNANYLYDLPEEKIAFIDSLVRPEYVSPPAVPGPGEKVDVAADPPGEADVAADPLEIPGVTADPREETGVTADPLGETGDDEEAGIAPDDEVKPDPVQPVSYTLYLFQEADTVQRITGAEAVRTGQVRITFRVPFESIMVREVRQELPENWNITEINPRRDTMWLWLRDPHPDSLFLEISDRGRVLDTLKLSSRPRPARERTAQDEVEPPPAVQLTMDAIRRNTWPYYKPISFKASAPVDSLDAELVTAMKNDSIPLDVRFVFEDNVRRTFILDLETEEEQSYSIKFLPGAVTDMFGATNDTIRRNFNTSAPSDYGRLIMNIVLPKGQESAVKPQYILQLLDMEGKTLQEKIIHEDGQYSFPHLDAGNYGLRLIEDRNGNGKWDPGIFLKGILPEPVYIYPDQLQVRQNWDMEMPWRP
jgi:hypothetical protein